MHQVEGTFNVVHLVESAADPSCSRRVRTQDTAARKVLWPADLAARYGRDASTIWRWRAGGLIPPPDVVLSPKVAGWYTATIEQHERRGAAAAGA
jgi:hypothetical protein